ncbi:MAG: Hpt domain-containing protein [Cystobacterineae bacterium]|nr:Hpt domain-containing protein [Cystobacterineae bacterium]
MSVTLFIVGKETTPFTPLKELLNTYAIETVFVQKTQTIVNKQNAEGFVFLENTQAEEWISSSHPPLPSLLLPESFPPPIPFKKLAESGMRLMPRETDGHFLAKLLFLDMELHRFPKSIASLDHKTQQSMLSIFEEFRHTLGEVHLQLNTLMAQLYKHPNAEKTRLEFRAIVHRLAGSAGSYGFMALSKIARALEHAIDKQETSKIHNLSQEFLEMLSLLLPHKTHEPPLSKTFLIYAPNQQTRNQYLHGFQSLNFNTVWGMDWAECWKLAQSYALSGAILYMDNLPLSSWPPLFEALGSSPAFAALPKHLVKHHPNEAEKTCAAQLGCQGLGTPPATFEEMAQMLQEKGE